MENAGIENPTIVYEVDYMNPEMLRPSTPTFG